MLHLLPLVASNALAGFAPTFSDNFNSYEVSPFSGTNSWRTEYPSDGWTTMGITGVQSASSTRIPPGTWGGTGDPVDNVLHKQGVTFGGDVRVDVRLDYANDVGYGNAIGVAWRYRAGTSYYLLAMSTRSGTLGGWMLGGTTTPSEAQFSGMRLFRVSGGAAVSLGQNTVPFLTAGTPQALRVEMVGSQITVQFDMNRNGVFDPAETYLTITDASPLAPGGEVGLYAYAGAPEQATFDDLVVSEVDSDDDGTADLNDTDDDNDTIADTGDNCRLTANTGQSDINNDGQGDACDDTDGDSYLDDFDNCVFDANDQRNRDGDALGDACDSDIDGDGWGNAEDCQVFNDLVNPGAIETCDGVDQDCDDLVDDGLSGCVDADRDGAPSAVDCDDNDPNRSPESPEQCNGVDDDCDGTIDDGASVSIAWYTDADADGHGLIGTPFTNNCQKPTGSYSWRSDDCRDTNASVYPGAAETCNGLDDDCDGDLDTDALDGPWYEDRDNDGFGGSGTSSCVPAGFPYTQVGGDCNDGQSGIAPGQTDICDLIDQDCDGNYDEDAPSYTWYRDADSDDWGDAFDATSACMAPAGYVEDLGDCDDNDEDLNPAAYDVPGDGVDQDCIDGDAPDPDLDDDEDGVTNGDEAALGLDPDASDSDGDGVDDLTELGDLADPVDSDGDGVVDAADADDDGDGVPSVDEGTEDFDGDGVADRLDVDSDDDGVADGAEQGDADGDGLPDARDDGSREIPAPPGVDDLGFGLGCASVRGGGLLGGLAALLFARRRRSRR